MSTPETMKSRLKTFAGFKGLTMQAFEKSVGLSNGHINNMKNALGLTKLESVLRVYPELSRVWLLTGEGEMLRTPDSQTQIISGDNNIATMGAHNKVNVTRQTSEPKPQISYSSGRPYYNVDFLGGFDQLTNDQTTTPEYNIDFAPYNRADVVWCNITGDSMEPRISSGDIIAIRPIHDWGVFLEYGKIYAIVTTNDIRTVKKVRKGSDKDHLLLVPENMEKYDEQEIQKSMIRHVFEVLGCMKKL